MHFAYIFVFLVKFLTGIVCENSTNVLPKESQFMYEPDTVGFDQIYVINLPRRTDRQQRLENVAEKLKLKLSFFEAVDGKNLMHEKLNKLGIKMLPGYREPNTDRPSLTYGEIGCALTHYYIWEDIVMKRFKKALILEDDAAFFPMFRKRWSRISADIDEFVPNWDLIYFGRKRMRAYNEKPVNGTKFVMWPDYSSWAMAYAINGNGARKLLMQKPLTKLIPVDEYIPIMYDKHPEEKWKQHFSPRDLVAVSVNPLLIEPAWFPGDKKYVSDTEFSPVANITTDNKHGDSQAM